MFLARVRAALRAAAERSAALRLRAAFLACFASAGRDAGARDSRFSAFFVARARLGEVRLVAFLPAL